ncbi:DNA polymerase III subunits gamma and tau [compost metagenome]
MGLIGRRDLPLAPDPRGGFEMVLLRMLAFRPADSDDAPRPVLKTVGISQATAESSPAVAVATPVVPVAASVAVVLNEPEPAPVAIIAPVPVPESAPAPRVAAAVEEVDLPWNEPKVSAPEPISEPVAEAVAAPVELPVQPEPTPAEVEQVLAPFPAPPAPDDDIGYSPAGMERDDEPPLDDDYDPVDMDSASYSFLDDLASEAAAPEPAEPELLPAAQPATGLALEWLELFPKLPISGMTGSIAANCTLVAVEGDHWSLHLDPAHSALFNATQQRRLNDALNQHHGRTLTLDIQLIRPEQETPAQAAARKRANRQSEAEASIHADPFIQQMMQQFGAIIRDDTIEPVDALVSQSE